MSLPLPFQTVYSGMRRDQSRDQLPGNTVWNLVDYFPDILQAPLRKRGGWAWGSPTLGGTAADRLINAEFTGGAQLLAVDNQATTHLWKVTDASTATDVGALNTTAGQAFLHRTYAIFLAGDGATTAKKYDGASISALSGSPQGKYGCVYKDYSVVSGVAAAPQSVYFSDPGDPTTWDTTLGVINVSSTVKGIAALRNAVLVLGTATTERIRGTIAPPGTDMIVEGLFKVGCIDSRSISAWNDNVIWCDTNGIYMTDGASLADITAQGGMKTYWRDLMASWTTSYRLVGGVYRDHYFMSVQNGSAFVDCLVCNLQSRTWFRLSNINARALTVVNGAFQDFYAASNTTDRLVRLTDIFVPAAGNKADADTTNVLPVVETGMQRGFIRVRRRWIESQGTTTWQQLYVSYDIRDAAADAPVLQVGYQNDPATASYTTLASTLPTTTAVKRGRLRLGFGKRMVGFKIAQVGPSSDTRLYTLESEYTTREVGNLAA